MLNRRKLIGGLTASATIPLLGGSGAALARDLAQELAGPAGFASPSRTFPFTPDVYRERRERLMEKMGGGIAVIYGAPTLAPGTLDPLTSQDNDFLYLTGIGDEAGAAILLIPGNTRGPREYLFLASRDIAHERWEGARLPDGAELERRTGFEDVYRSGALGGFATSFAAHHKQMHFLGPIVGPSQPVPPPLQLYGNISARVPGTRIENSANLIRDMRVAKEPRELALIRKSIAATEAGLNAAMRAVRPGMTQRELKAIVENGFRAAGADGLGFTSNVSNGKATAVLHYSGNDMVIEDGDMVLCDVGAQVGGYSADITRTFPANGRFNEEQRRVYSTVLEAQAKAVATLKAGSYYSAAQDAAEAVIDAAGHGDDFWHGLGHFIGLHVHDVGDLRAPLADNATLTVEPGIYLPDRGFGVRIEDDYLITRDGAEHLSNGCPNDPDAIEALMNA